MKGGKENNSSGLKHPCFLPLGNSSISRFPRGTKWEIIEADKERGGCFPLGLSQACQHSQSQCCCWKGICFQGGKVRLAVPGNGLVEASPPSYLQRGKKLLEVRNKVRARVHDWSRSSENEIKWKTFQACLIWLDLFLIFRLEGGGV